MLIGSNRLSDLILEDLCSHPASSAREIAGRLDEKGVAVSRQSMHRNLSQLRKLDVLITEGGRYSLKLSWLIRARRFINDASHVYFSREFTSQMQPDMGESKEWRFSNLFEMDSFGCHVDVALLRTVDDENYFAWEPFPWYVPFAPEQEQGFVESLRELGKVRHIVVGGVSALHKIRQGPAADAVYQLAYAPEFYPEMNFFEYLYGDFILKVEVPEETASRLQHLFECTPTIRDLDLAELRRIAFGEAGGVVLRLKRNRVEATEKRGRYLAKFASEEQSQYA